MMCKSVTKSEQMLFTYCGLVGNLELLFLCYRWVFSFASLFVIFYFCAQSTRMPLLFAFDYGEQMWLHYKIYCDLSYHINLLIFYLWSHFKLLLTSSAPPRSFSTPELCSIALILFIMTHRETKKWRFITPMQTMIRQPGIIKLPLASSDRSMCLAGRRGRLYISETLDSHALHGYWRDCVAESSTVFSSSLESISDTTESETDWVRETDQQSMIDFVTISPVRTTDSDTDRRE